MGVINATVNGAALPISIVVRMVGETTGNRCTSGCNDFPVTFTHDTGDNSYYFIVTDANGCVTDSRTVSGGISNINCDVTQPEFDAEFIMPTCNPDGSLNDAIIRLTNVSNSARYKICYNTTTMNCAACTVSDGTITGSSIDIPSPVATGSSGNRAILLRVYKDSTCDSYKEWFHVFTVPTCTATPPPTLASAIVQPVCSAQNGGTPLPAVVKLTNINNATRYKICYNTSTFTCTGTCSSSDGIITGSSLDIEIPAPSAGITQNNVIRVFNGSSCNYYVDIPISIRSSNCGSEITLMYLDLLMLQNSGTAKCNVLNTYGDNYQMYVQSITPGVTENTQKAVAISVMERTVPNGNDVPNVYVAGPIKASCGSDANQNEAIGTIFYRFSWNLAYMKAKYPSINEFSFDVYANKLAPGVASSPVSVPNRIVVVTNAFKGVAMIKDVYTNIGSVDANRTPFYSGFACTKTTCAGAEFNNTTTDMSDIVYNTSVSGYRKIGNIKYNYTSNKITWTKV